LQSYDPDDALFQWQAEDEADAENVARAIGSRRRGRSSSLTLSQSHATKKRKFNASPERSQPRDVLSAHQAARSGKSKDVQKKPAKSTKSRAQQAIPPNPFKSKGIPDIREVQRAAADRERELNVHNNGNARKDRNDPGEVRFDDGDNDFYAYGQREEEEDQVDKNESAALDVPKSRKSRKRKKKRSKASEEAPRPASPDATSDSTDTDTPLTHIGAYTPRSQVLLKHTKLGFRERIYTINPFPSDALRTQFGQEAWQEATEKYTSTFLKG
jgi:hypothetical protein